MRIGDLRQRITLESPTLTGDAMGSSMMVWADEGTVWAAVWPISAQEQIQSAGTAMVATHRVQMRYRSDLLPTWRVKFGERYLAIVSLVNRNELNRTLDLIC